MGRAVNNFSGPLHTFPAEVKQGEAVFQFSYYKQVSFCGLFNAMFLTFFVGFFFLVVILLFKMSWSIVHRKLWYAF